MRTINGFENGQTAWSAFVYVRDGGDGPATASVHIREVTVLIAADGIIRCGDSARAIGVGETLHHTQSEARAWAAAEIRVSVENLRRQADDLADPVVVTV